MHADRDVICAGVLANQLFPNWLITVLLLLLLIFLTHMTVKKALSLHRAEVQYKAEQAADRSGTRAKADSPGSSAAAADGGACAEQRAAAARAADECEAGPSADAAAYGAAGDVMGPGYASLEVEQPVRPCYFQYALFIISWEACSGIVL